MLGHRELTMEDYAGHSEAAILVDSDFCDHFPRCWHRPHLHSSSSVRVADAYAH